MMKLFALVGVLCFCGVHSRSYLPRNMDKYENYNDAYIDQLRDKDWSLEDRYDNYDFYDDRDYSDEDYSDEDYSGDYYSDESYDDDDEDRDYQEWLKERQLQEFGNVKRERDPFEDMEDDWDPYYEQQQRRGYVDRRRPSPKMEVYGRKTYVPRSEHKTEEEVMRLRGKLSEMQNEINSMKSMFRRQRYPYDKK